ncbi:hypothetical protein AB1N83_012000 [Pleurotus pulmonarius]
MERVDRCTIYDVARDGLAFRTVEMKRRDRPSASRANAATGWVSCMPDPQRSGGCRGCRGSGGGDLG